MIQDYKELENKINGSEFNTFCKKILSGNINELEAKRKQYIFLINALIFISICLCIGVIILMIPVIQSGYSSIEHTIVIILFGVAIPCLCACLYSREYFEKLYKKDFKKIITKKLFKFVGDFQYISPKKYLQEDRNYAASLSLLPEFGRFHCDDRLKGTYKGLPIDIMDVRLYSMYREKRGYPILFKGVLITLPFNKEIKNKIFVRNVINVTFDDIKNRIYLEDPEFNKYFLVSSDDQIEARYILTTALMNRLVELQKTNLVIDLSLENNKLNIAISSSLIRNNAVYFGTNNDWFDVKLFQSADDINVYRQILLDLVKMLSIIDSLKLDQKIGL